MYCYDLGVQLVPVIEEFFASEQHRTGIPIPGVHRMSPLSCSNPQLEGDHITANPPISVNSDLDVPNPINLEAWIASHASELADGPQHIFNTPEFTVIVDTGSKPAVPTSNALIQTWLWPYVSS